MKVSNQDHHERLLVLASQVIIMKKLHIMLKLWTLNTKHNVIAIPIKNNKN